ncbi:MAG: hypothetical protein KF869_03110 [Phycisphaeraceae bacterium]|nr:hypothetical protein [Phycisphaeraceae bacterium]
MCRLRVQERAAAMPRPGPSTMEPGNDGRNESGSNSLGKDQPRAGGGAGAARAAIGGFARAALGAMRSLRAAWERLRPPQQFVLGFALLSTAGAALLCFPFMRERPVSFTDNLFNAVSAATTTGLVTTATAESYSFAGELLLLVLFQIGAIGFMTIASVFILARGGKLEGPRLGVLRAGFSLPHYFVMRNFVVHVAVFTVVCEVAGAIILAWRFAALGIERPLWSGVFHSVSAFATAGFGLHGDSLERFRGDWVVNLTIGTLAYLGAIGFIVAQDVWYSFRLRERLLTFTSKVILVMTGSIFVLGSALLFFVDPSIRALPNGERLLAAAFQTMTASTTAGFNTVPIGGMGHAALLVIMLAMLVGASPSGTGGGIKTTSISALVANLLSVLRGREVVAWLGHEVPMLRVLYAAAAATFYLAHLGVGLLLLCLTERQPFLPLLFEAASALGTVGLSMGITADLSTAGKLIVIVLMLAGRCGPLTIGLALMTPAKPAAGLRGDDLAI